MENGQVTVVKHALVQHKLSLMREKETGTRDFRTLVTEIATFLCYEAMRDLPTEEVEIETPICKTMVPMISGKKLAYVPILRAGMGMLDGALSLTPVAKVGHIGMYRNEKTLEPIEYYKKLPDDIAERDVFILDPMLATGGSACDAISAVKRSNPKSITFVCIVSAPCGLERVCKEHPDVPIYTAAIDEKLNENGYIVPGLGDAGDRIYGTRLSSAKVFHSMKDPVEAGGQTALFAVCDKTFMPRQENDGRSQTKTGGSQLRLVSPVFMRSMRNTGYLLAQNEIHCGSAAYGFLCQSDFSSHSSGSHQLAPSVLRSAKSSSIRATVNPLFSSELIKSCTRQSLSRMSS